MKAIETIDDVEPIENVGELKQDETIDDVEPIENVGELKI